MPQHIRNRSTSFIVLHLLFLVPKIGDEISISLLGKIGNALALCNASFRCRQNTEKNRGQIKEGKEDHGYLSDMLPSLPLCCVSLW